MHTKLFRVSSAAQHARIGGAVAVCKVNLRDMGATSGKVYSPCHIIERQVDDRMVGLTDVFVFLCSVASGERFAEAMRSDAGDADVPVGSLASFFSYGLP